MMLKAKIENADDRSVTEVEVPEAPRVGDAIQLSLAGDVVHYVFRVIWTPFEENQDVWIRVSEKY